MDNRPRYRVPDELRETLLDFTIAYLLERPPNLVDFGIQFFQRLKGEREQGGSPSPGSQLNGRSNEIDDNDGSGARGSQRHHRQTRKSIVVPPGPGITSGGGTAAPAMVNLPFHAPLLPAPDTENRVVAVLEQRQQQKKRMSTPTGLTGYPMISASPRRRDGFLRFQQQRNRYQTQPSSSPWPRDADLDLEGITDTANRIVEETVTQARSRLEEREEEPLAGGSSGLRMEDTRQIRQLKQYLRNQTGRQIG